MEQDTLIQVEIHGRMYNLRSGGDPESVRRVAEFVDSQMQQMADQTRTADTTRIAILAALNIASELFEARRAGGESARPAAIRARDEALSRVLDEVLLA